jgi:hypothetical protein
MAINKAFASGRRNGFWLAKNEPWNKDKRRKADIGVMRKQEKDMEGLSDMFSMADKEVLRREAYNKVQAALQRVKERKAREAREARAIAEMPEGKYDAYAEEPPAPPAPPAPPSIFYDPPVVQPVVQPELPKSINDIRKMGRIGAINFLKNFTGDELYDKYIDRERLRDIATIIGMKHRGPSGLVSNAKNMAQRIAEFVR